MWKNTNFSVKVIALVCVLTLFAALTAVGYHSMSNQIRDIGIESAGEEMLSGYKNELKDIVDVMALTLAAATEGETDTKKVHETYSTLARGARFFPDNSGYFFVFENGVTVLHAAQPDLEGKDLIDLQDVNKVYVIKELDDIAKAGGGYLEYHWDKPGKGNQPKLSYTRMIPDSPYSIGAGVYIDDIEEREQAILTTMNDYTTSFLTKWALLLLAVFFLVVLPLAIYMIKNMTAPLAKLTEIAAEYSRGAWDSEIEYTDRKDEIGALSRAIKRLGSSTRMVMKKLEDTKSK